jgi:hypothetical protein
VARRKASRPAAAIAAREPRVVSEHAGEPLGGEANFDPCRCLAVYADGNRCIGFLLPRGKSGIEAFDADTRALGFYPSLKSAADAISAKAAS